MERIRLEGQWFGFFKYGEQYGEILNGQKVVKSLIFENISDNIFNGKCIELNGIGANEEISGISGFVENNFISFKKEYQTYYQFEDDGTTIISQERGAHELSYEGVYDAGKEAFFGTW